MPDDNKIRLKIWFNREKYIGVWGNWDFLCTKCEKAGDGNFSNREMYIGFGEKLKSLCIERLKNGEEEKFSAGKKL